MKTAAMLLIASLVSGSSVAPGLSMVVLRGTVTDSSTGKALNNASVMVVGMAPGTQTDGQGRYELRFTPVSATARITVMVRRVGYAARSLPLNLAGRSEITADFALTPSQMRLEGVVVTGVESRDAARVRERAGAASGKTGVKQITPMANVLASPSGMSIRRQREPGNTEGYAVIDENPYFLARERALSTFSVDVDRASYSNVRRFLTQGQRPPRDAVRIEELVNYFPYSYPEPRAGDPVSISTSVAAAPWNRSHRLVMIGLKARSIATASLPPNNLVFLIDVSGSMMSPDKLPLVKSAFELLVNQLRPQDRVSIVVYAGSAGLVLPSTPGNNRKAIMDAITRLEAGGSTAGGAGLRLAYDIAGSNFMKNGNNRVILATDGDFNVGESSDAEMVRLIEARRSTGVFLTTLGFGTGNIKDSKLEQLADRGNGHYAYVDNLLEAKKMFVRELGATLRTVAKDVKLQIEFNPQRVAAYRLIGYENRLLNDADFADDTKDAGDMGSGHTVTALYEVVPVGAPMDSLIPKANDLRYQRPSAGSRSASGGELLYVKLRYKEPEGATSRLMTRAVRDAMASQSSDFAFASAVAEFGMLLRDSKYKGKATYASVAELASATLGNDPDGLRREFVTLVRQAETVARHQRAGRGGSFDVLR
ncbi:MAG: von Willebrand factor type A domain-containing protein [Gemmatimonadota bacterium]|nr:von Willebrand factor type A domain-containing protein [Gemmatimonadota bacterium]